MRGKREIWALVAALFLSAAAACAQNQPQDPRTDNPDAPLPPISDTAPDPNAPANATAPDTNAQPPLPAARGLSPAYESAENNPASAVPDTNTLAGIGPVGLGTMGVQHDLFDPAVMFSLIGDSQGERSNGTTGLALYELAAANIFYTHLWGHNQFSANYSGGESVYDGPEPNGAFQNVLLQQEFVHGRWTTHLLDAFIYSPAAVFGGGGMGGPGLINEFSGAFGTSLQTLGEFFVPSQTIETGYARRYSNTALAEAQYAFSRRSALTVSGNYGLLNFITPGYISSRQWTVQAGYDYQFSPKNTFAVLGNYEQISFLDYTTFTQDYFAALAYGRKITGRLAFEVAVGPEQIKPEQIRPIGPLSKNYELWMTTVRSALTYQRRRTGISASFVRGLQNGSGVFFGARSDTAAANVSYQVTRMWTASVSSGYAFNEAIIAVGPNQTSFNHFYAGVSAGRQLNAHARIDINYGLQKQDRPAFCPVLNCGFTGYDNTFAITANWHLHPVLQ